MPTTAKPPYKPGDLVVYEDSQAWCLLRVIRVVRRGNHRDNTRKWVIYVDGFDQGLYEAELSPYVEADHA